MKYDNNIFMGMFTLSQPAVVTQPVVVGGGGVVGSVGQGQMPVVYENDNVMLSAMAGVVLAVLVVIVMVNVFRHH